MTNKPDETERIDAAAGDDAAVAATVESVPVEGGPVAGVPVEGATRRQRSHKVEATDAPVDDLDEDGASDSAPADVNTPRPALRGEPTARWAPEVPIRKGYGGSALSFSLAGLAASFFVGWAFPLALIGLVLGIVAIVKREESTTLGVWSVGLAVLALVYSAGWLWWANSILHWI